MSPIDFNKLSWLQPLGTSIDASGKIISTIKGAGSTVSGVVPVLAKVLQQPAQLSKWEANGKFYYAYETIGNTYRDFAIPLSTKLFGQSVTSADGTQQMLQDYLLSRTVAWVKGTGNFASGFSSFSQRGGTIGLAGPDDDDVAGAPRTRRFGYRQDAMPYQTSLELASANGRTAVRFGYGDGAVALGRQAGLAMISDYDVNAGGTNPLLGMASGGAYANVEAELVPGLRLSTGYTEQMLKRDPRAMSFNELTTIDARGTDRKRAMTIGVSYSPLRAVTLHVSMTQLDEADAVLGVRSIDPADFGRGAATRGATLGADLALGHGLALTASATRGTTRDRGNAYRNLSVGAGGLGTSAYEVAVSKFGLLGRSDKVRLSLSQPMHIDSGNFDFRSVEVVDRDTGELGIVPRRASRRKGPRANMSANSSTAGRCSADRPRSTCSGAPNCARPAHPRVCRR